MHVKVDFWLVPIGFQICIFHFIFMPYPPLWSWEKQKYHHM